jgi:hypothetical protein
MSFTCCPSSLVLLRDFVVLLAQHTKMAFPYVFVLGRPGSGKSELYTQAVKILTDQNIEYARLDDVRELRKLIHTDKEHKYKLFSFIVLCLISGQIC